MRLCPFVFLWYLSLFLHLAHYSCRKDIVSLFSSETLCIERLLCRIHGIMEQDRRCRVIKVKSLHLLFLDSTLELLRFVSFWILVTWKRTVCLPQEQWQWVAASRLYLRLSGVQYSGVTEIQGRLPDWVTASDTFVTCPYYIEILRDGRVESSFQRYERNVQIMDCFSTLLKSVFQFPSVSSATDEAAVWNTQSISMSRDRFVSCIE